MPTTPNRAIVPLLAALCLPCRPAPAQDPAALLAATTHSLATATAAALPHAKDGVPVHAELERDGARVVFSIDLARGPRSVNVVLAADSLAKLETSDEADDFAALVAATHVTMSAATATAEQASGARAIEAELRSMAGRPVFRVRLFQVAEQVVVVDAVTGGIVDRAPAAAAGGQAANATEPPFTAVFEVAREDLVSRGSNRFFVLEPGHTLALRGAEGGKPVELTVTVLDETRTVDGVEVRVVEEREQKDGQLVEVSRNFFAISRRTSDVYYFGEEVDIYRDGKVVDHGGAWQSGVGGARFGLMMPGTALLGSRYYQEIAPKVAMDRAENLALDEVVTCEAGEFSRCLRTVETTPLEPGERGTKVYAPGIGLVVDGPLRLVRHGTVR